MDRCPKCGSKLSYVGATDINCSNPNCEYYKEEVEEFEVKTKKKSRTYMWNDKTKMKEEVSPWEELWNGFNKEE